MMSFLITEYQGRHGLSNRALALKLGFNYHTIGRWKLRQFFPNLFSAECLLNLFLRDVEPVNHAAYTRYFWDVWRFDHEVKKQQRGKHELCKST